MALRQQFIEASGINKQITVKQEIVTSSSDTTMSDEDGQVDTDWSAMVDGYLGDSEASSPNMTIIETTSCTDDSVPPEDCTEALKKRMQEDIEAGRGPMAPTLDEIEYLQAARQQAATSTATPWQIGWSFEGAMMGHCAVAQSLGSSGQTLNQTKGKHETSTTTTMALEDSWKVVKKIPKLAMRTFRGARANSLTPPKY